VDGLFRLQSFRIWGIVGSELIKEATIIMSELNAKVAEIMNKFPVNACTDVTGFGLLGHLKEMTTASMVNTEIYFNKIPVIDGVFELALSGIIPGGTKNNMDFVKPDIIYDKNISEIGKLIINDAQTSGGLLISVPLDFKDEFINECVANGISSTACIGTITEKGNGKIHIVKHSLD